MLARTAYAVARMLGVPWLSRRLFGGAVILCYHNVVTESDREAQDPALHMPVHVFESQMRWICRHLKAVSLDVLVQRLRNAEPTRDLVALTFDDAYEGFFRFALPILRSLELPSAVFVVANAAERPEPFWWDHPALVPRAPARREEWLTRAQGIAANIFALEGVGAPPGLSSELLPAPWDTIRRHLGPDLTIGAHTCGHPALTTVNGDDLHHELRGAADRIAARLGNRPRYLAYPYGSWNSAVRDAARIAGYDAALTLDAGRLRAGAVDLLALPRINVPAGISPAAFEAWASNLLPRVRASRESGRR